MLCMNYILMRILLTIFSKKYQLMPFCLEFVIFVVDID